LSAIACAVLEVDSSVVSGFWGGPGVGSAISTTVNSGGFALANGGLLTGLIAGFSSPSGVNEAIDLRDISFGTGTSVKFTEAAGNTSGTLTVTDETHTANLTLLGQYSTANFSLSSDGHGGTLVTDPQPGSAGSPVLATHA
jgi:hypothetical protein